MICRKYCVEVYYVFCEQKGDCLAHSSGGVAEIVKCVCSSVAETNGKVSVLGVQMNASHQLHTPDCCTWEHGNRSRREYCKSIGVLIFERISGVGMNCSIGANVIGSAFVLTTVRGPKAPQYSLNYSPRQSFCPTVFPCANLLNNRRMIQSITILDSCVMI
eukprot:scaffold3423_cov170-Chaetoceros_neogracile.AAC.1